VVARLALVVGGALGAAGVAGCASSPPMVDKREVAEEISAHLEERSGRAPDSVTCRENLRGEVGTVQRCELKNGPETYGVTVTVTGVKGGDVDFNITVDDHPS
jgi:hypothetical protein